MKTPKKISKRLVEFITNSGWMNMFYYTTFFEVSSKNKYFITYLFYPIIL